MKKPGFLLGLLVGLILTIPLIALFYLGYQMAALHFTPFTPLDWTARNLPGPIVTFGIDTMVGTIRALGLNVSDIAKLAEQAMSIMMTIGLGGVVSAVFFLVLKRMKSAQNALMIGAIVGGVVGIGLFLLQTTLPDTSTIDPILGFVWTVGLFALWGLAVGYALVRLTGPAAAVEADAATVSSIDRRRFLIQMGGAAAVVTVAGAGVGAMLSPRLPDDRAGLPEATPSPEQMAALPNAGDPVVPAPGTRPEITPLADHYRIDINTLPPSVAAETYVLPFTTIIGSDTAEKSTLKSYTLDEIVGNFDAIDAYITMSCISNSVGGDLISTTQWTGVPMQAVLADVGVPDGATHLKMYAADGFDETVALSLIDADPRVMLCYAWEGQPLTIEHGFPLRIHIPNHYGMKQPKWITEFEFLAQDNDGYWVRRGWDKNALVKMTSVIDTVAVESPIVNGDRTLIPVGGIAWSGDRGISKVEVQVDGGEWVEAQLRAPISDRTWTIWRYDWPFAEGAHTFTVRATEGDGTPQIEAAAGVRPSGATGYHELRRSVEAV
ncbi:MAG TPA: molybdopterin-dependent oxidoreductase [Candidatus Limnocylindrales bacterium]|nr:molybdopterin-dependent oxidoreductase [Candidatus Limnocylindrales bacterium]